MKKNIFFLFLIILSLTRASFASDPSLTLATKQEVPAIRRLPVLTTTAIIEIYQGDQFKGIVLIERGKAPWGKALPGGKVEYGETVEEAVRREMQEEVGLELFDLKQFHVYSNPKRDHRHHSIEVTHLARSNRRPHAGDDAAKAWICPLDEIPWKELAFDHAQILQDYLDYRAGDQSRLMVKP
jgi:8-oxo-dGTP diphosphatase